MTYLRREFGGFCYSSQRKLRIAVDQPAFRNTLLHFADS